MSVANAVYNDDDFNLPTADEYVPQGATILPQPGNYRVKVTSMKRKTDKNGQVVMQEGKYPIIQVQRIEILEPEAEAGTFQCFQDIRTKPYNRKGQGRQVSASDAADVLMAIDAEGISGLSDFEDVGKELEQRLASGADFSAYIGYTGYDKAQAERAVAALGPNPSQEAKNAAYNTAKLNTKSFRGPTGAAATKVKGPSGAVVEAKLKLTSYVPASETVTFGPTKVGPKNG